MYFLFSIIIHYKWDILNVVTPGGDVSARLLLGRQSLLLGALMHLLRAFIDCGSYVVWVEQVCSRAGRQVRLLGCCTAGAADPIGLVF